MKKGVPEIAPSIRATCADCVRSSSAILATGVSGRELRTDASPFPRRLTEPTGRIEREPLGDVLGVAIDHPPQLTRPGEESPDATLRGRLRSRLRRRGRDYSDCSSLGSA